MEKVMQLATEGSGATHCEMQQALKIVTKLLQKRHRAPSVPVSDECVMIVHFFDASAPGDTQIAWWFDFIQHVAHIVSMTFGCSSSFSIANKQVKFKGFVHQVQTTAEMYVNVMQTIFERACADHLVDDEDTFGFFGMGVARAMHHEVIRVQAIRKTHATKPMWHRRGHPLHQIENSLAQKKELEAKENEAYKHGEATGFMLRQRFTGFVHKLKHEL